MVRKLIGVKRFNSSGANQMQFMKKLMLSKLYFERVAATELVANQGERYNYIAATKGKSYALFYTYTGREIAVNMGFIRKGKITAYWFNPRDGSFSTKKYVRQFRNSKIRSAGRRKARKRLGFGLRKIKITMKKLLVSIALMFGLASISFADVRLPDVLANSMVLQQKQKVPIWGTADAGETVVVSFQKQKLTAVADANGKWRVDLKPLKASFTPRNIDYSRQE